jgi:hypothetical protein
MWTGSVTPSIELSRGPSDNQLTMDEQAGNTAQRRAASRGPIGILDLCRALQA